jgi:hypothetical protein
MSGPTPYQPKVNVKPLIHWAIYKGYTVRITQRTLANVEGILSTPEGPLTFRFDPQHKLLELSGRRLTLNDYGWEVSQEPLVPPEAG